MSSTNQRVDTFRVSGLRVRGYNSTECIFLPSVYTRDVIPANRKHTPTPEAANMWPHLQSIAHEFSPILDCTVGLLIGFNCPKALAPERVVLPTFNGPFAQRTVLGWGIVGVDDSQCDYYDDIGISHRVLTYEVPKYIHNTCSELGVTMSHVHCACKTKVKEVVTPKDIIDMMEIDFNERKSSSYSQDDLKFLSILEKGIHQCEDKHLEMLLPFKNENPKLPNTRALALTRLNQLERRFNRDSKYREDYVQFMEEIVLKGYAERVPESELELPDGQVSYIPHHGVYHKKKNKIRVVFDCSAKFMGESLNDHLLPGPSLTNTLLGVLCRFRHEYIAVMCDIEKMFYQFKVDKDHRNFLRFFWWENGNIEMPPFEYRMTVHLFGAASSPGCANFGLKYLASKYEHKYGSDACNVIHRNFYVDDGLKSVASEEETIDLVKRVKDICSEGGIRLHKFISNSTVVTESLDTDDLASNTRDLNLLKENDHVERALGMHWCIEADQFTFRITLKDYPCTRRGILGTVNSVYDPLGLIATLACNLTRKADSPGNVSRSARLG
ncbi:hypothetical protein HOLleu_37335 [Holothuria leucospilota]|uniref:Reverse transcriptase domain-containing protein n=1 Tax=Holothuria leucospilota TaxID=206669 RepID=A0A9Q0YGZ9_HOLLE|nr:hypothetical protein HOLleu_37335 [Holothuria leucospilota]